MPNRNDLHINPVRPTDSGTFECHVTYHGSTSVEYPVTVNIVCLISVSLNMNFSIIFLSVREQLHYIF